MLEKMTLRDMTYLLPASGTSLSMTRQKDREGQSFYSRDRGLTAIALLSKHLFPWWPLGPGSVSKFLQVFTQVLP